MNGCSVDLHFYIAYKNSIEDVSGTNFAREILTICVPSPSSYLSTDLRFSNSSLNQLYLQSKFYRANLGLNGKTVASINYGFEFYTMR